MDKTLDTPNQPTHEVAFDRDRVELILLALSMGVAAACGLLYQLILGALSTYLIGNSVYQYSITIGLFMFSYGVGSWLSGYIRRELLVFFICTEIAVGIVGGLSGFLLTLSYIEGPFFEVTRVLMILIVGSLVGIEVPLLVRLFEKRRNNLRLSLAQLMSVDYVGALFAGLAFPIILLPTIGLLGSGLVAGLINVTVTVILIYSMRSPHLLPSAWKRLLLVSGGAFILLATLLYFLKPIEWYIESQFYTDRVTYYEQSPYQRIVLTQHKDDTRLYLDGSLQFSSKDEYRYHESLVHPAATRVEKLERVLILGGGDGLAIRELKKYPSIKRIDLVDLDSSVVRLAKKHSRLLELNGHAFDSDDVHVHHADAYNWIREQAEQLYDLVIVDLPDPHHVELAKLYSISFYKNLSRLIARGGLMTVQSGSPMFSKRSYWLNHNTIRQAGLHTYPYHVNVPSFGEWGFVMAHPEHHASHLERDDLSNKSAKPLRKAPHDLQYYSVEIDHNIFTWPADLKHNTPLGETTTLIHPRVAYTFESDWREWN